MSSNPALLAFGILLLASASGRECADDLSFTDSYGWTCHAYDRATEQCYKAHHFAVDGVHAGHKCCACRKAWLALDELSFDDAVVKRLTTRRRQRNQAACFADCQAGNRECNTDCENTRNDCNFDCSETLVTCETILCANSQFIDEDVGIIDEDEDEIFVEDEGVQWWVIVLILIFVLCFVLACCGALYYFVMPSMAPKRVDAGATVIRQSAYSPAVARPSCNAPQDEEDCGCDDGVPMLIQPSPDGPRGGYGNDGYVSTLPPQFSVPRGPSAACGPQPQYGGGY